jgi:putative flippase GtrA
MVNEGLRYMVMTAMSAVLSLGVPFVLYEGFSVPPNIAVAVGLAAAFLANFATAKLYVFRKNGSIASQFGRYAFVSVLFRGAEYVAFLLVHDLLGIQYMAALIGVLFTSFLLKFMAYKLFVFTHHQEPFVAPGA